MEKKDVAYMVAALAVVLVIALVVKPLATGHPLNTGIPLPATTPTPSSSVAPPTPTPLPTTLPAATPSTPVPTRPPTTVPTWNPNTTNTLGFVNPATYNVSLSEPLPGGTQIVAATLDTNMTTFATIASSTGSSGTTAIFYMPFPYWEMVYTINPTPALKPSSVAPAPSSGTGVSYSGISGSYSTATPAFTIQVMDGDDPNRIVRTISPPGGIDLNLWTGVQGTAHENPSFQTNQLHPVGPVPTPVDPRPWTEKFYEGQRHYYFIITAQSIDSYSIKIQVPTRYIGKY